jgi:phage protein D
VRTLKPIWLVTYEGAEVSDELAPMVTAITYTDVLSPSPPKPGADGKPEAPKSKADAPADASDELTLTVEDRVGRWRHGWFPATGDRVAVQLGYEGQPLLNCGQFAVDEVELGGPPDTVQIRTLATPMTEALRSPQSRSFEGLTLRELIEHVAAELELELVGEVADLPIDRVTQSSETTLAFVRRLAAEYGYAFAVRPPQFVFYALKQLEAQPPVLTVRRVDLKGYRLKSSVQNTYAACIVSWFDPATKAVREVRVDEQYTRQSIVIGAADGTAGDGSSAAAAPPVVPTRVLQVGVTGDDVRGWQQFMTSQGIDCGPVDGIFGPLTRAGTQGFQQRASITVDGIAGPETFRAAVEAGYGAAGAAGELGAGAGTRAETAGAILRAEVRVETVEQAEEKARSLLAAANRLRVTGSLSLQGDPRLVAGANFDLVDMGRLSGRFSIQKSTHSMARGGGYGVEVEVVGI